MQLTSKKIMGIKEIYEELDWNFDLDYLIEWISHIVPEELYLLN